jgi:hypothetical protein
MAFEGLLCHRSLDREAVKLLFQGKGPMLSG